MTPRTPREARSLSLAPIMRFKLSNILYAFAIGIASPYIILRTNEIAKDYFAIVIGLSMLASAMGAYLAGFYLKPRKITLSLNRIIEMIVLLLFGYAGTLMQILTLNCIIGASAGAGESMINARVAGQNSHFTKNFAMYSITITAGVGISMILSSLVKDYVFQIAAILVFISAYLVYEN